MSESTEPRTYFKLRTSCPSRRSVREGLTQTDDTVVSVGVQG